MKHIRILKSKALLALNAVLRKADLQLVRNSDLWRPTATLGHQPEPPTNKTISPADPLLQAFGAVSQTFYDFAVVMPTTVRPTIRDALHSIFDQDFAGSVQVLVGVDKGVERAKLIDEICRNAPKNVSVFLFYPGYSTSRRHGGLHAAWDGGALRTILSYMANSRHVAYLDDDNWWAPSHLSSMKAALESHDWAYAKRWFVHPSSRLPICEDQWESIGPGQGTFAPIGGWVDPNCLAIDKLSCEAVLPWWSIPLRNSKKAMDADRNVFRILRTEFRGRSTEKATVFYAIDEKDVQHPERMQIIGVQRYNMASSSIFPD